MPDVHALLRQIEESSHGELGEMRLSPEDCRALIECVDDLSARAHHAEYLLEE